MEGIQFIKTLTEVEQEMCENVKRLLDTLNEKSKPLYNSVTAIL